MPNMDGTGPRFNAPRGYGRGMGMCGRGFGPRDGRGLGVCRFTATDSPEALKAYKAALEARLAEVDKKLSTL